MVDLAAHTAERRAQDATRIASLEQTIERIFRDRREADKVTAYCLEACPHLVTTASTRKDPT